MNQVHKETLSAIENALPNRSNLDVEIFGMEGIPEDVVASHKQRVVTQFAQAEAEHRAATGNPAPGSGNAAKKPKFEAASDMKKRLAEHKAKVAAEKAAAEQAAATAPPSNGEAPPMDGQAPGYGQTPGFVSRFCLCIRPQRLTSSEPALPSAIRSSAVYWASTIQRLSPAIWPAAARLSTASWAKFPWWACSALWPAELLSSWAIPAC